ncbi:carbon-nitrogen hydrolase family protein [Sphaerisporangium sp. B11E5]|uniref:carbon-nitrogen hydrolase family protein n=1 Tax=Sphaerisporangium sp. B11E5 TaxID=3153563 RepID=UPI00325DCC82
MRGPLTIAVAQPPCAVRDVAANAAAHAEAVRAARARVVVFPELSLTGYELGAPLVSPDDPRLAALIEACAETGTVALAGAPVGGEGGAAYIAMLAVDGLGVTVAYRKMFLGGAEPGRFTPGGEPAVLEVDGRRLGLAICKDTGVPEHAAKTAALGVDVYAAGVCEHERDAAVPDERARRIIAEHGVAVAVAGFAGPAGGEYTRTPGRSSIRACDGTVLAQAGPEPGAVVRATLG